MKITSSVDKLAVFAEDSKKLKWTGCAAIDTNDASSPLDCKALRRNFKVEEATQIQVIKDLSLELENRLANRQLAADLLENNNAIETLKEKGCPDYILKEFTDNNLNSQIEATKEHLEALKQLHEELSGISLQESAEHEITEDQAGNPRDCQTFCQTIQAAGQVAGPRLLNCFSPDDVGGGMGHTMLIDTSKNLFYDSNFGFYKYESLEDCQRALYDHVLTTYPYLLRGKFQVQAVTLNT